MVVYVAALSSDVTQPPCTPPWNAPSGAHVTQTTTFSTQEKKFFNAFSTTFVAKFEDLTAPQGRRRWRTWWHCRQTSPSRHVPHVPTLDWSEWRPSHQNQSLIHTIKHRQNNQGLRHFLHYFSQNISPQYSLQHGKTVKR